MSLIQPANYRNQALEQLYKKCESWPKLGFCDVQVAWEEKDKNKQNQTKQLDHVSSDFVVGGKSYLSKNILHLALSLKNFYP